MRSLRQRCVAGQSQKLSALLARNPKIYIARLTQVMKYGKNQWARISSLLVRKSAKQCKARWYEWLDPSIKKTEWTREEDEKLLHLAKLMPTQWRTIAPIVGRTPSQCLERYEKLLDAGMQRDEDYDAASDPRRLRPGEIDPHPETKPARPDPVDMDEDEKEMLSEARARLANTRGKKAKRKAREKQLEEARRLASLQKRRELKAAGIAQRGGGRRVMGIDYNAEIAFQKRAPAGFFDVSAENAAAKEAGEQPFKPLTMAELEGPRRRDIEENLMRQDVKRQKIHERHDTPAAVVQVNKLNDVDGTRRRSKLMLPAPQMSDRELEELAKLGGPAALDDGGEGSGATRALLGSYAATPGPGATPLRTPRAQTARGDDYSLQEAENLRAMQRGSALLGGEAAPMHASDFSGATPRLAKAVFTPNPLVTPLRTPAGGPGGATPGATPGRGGPGATPARGAGGLRDELGINDGDAGAALLERARAAALRRELREGLSALPAPRNEYQISVPELPGADEEEEAMEEDAADAVTRRKLEVAAAEEAALARRSQVLQRGLPRPTGSPPSAAAPGAAASALGAELAALLEHDAAVHPLRKDKRQPSAPPLPEFDPAALAAAGALVAAEAAALRAELNHGGITQEEYDAAWAAATAHVPSLWALQAEFEDVRGEMERDAKRASKLDAKIGTLTGGYQKRAAELSARLSAAHQAASDGAAELAAFRSLHNQELRAATLRIEALAAEVATQAERERSLQARFAELDDKTRAACSV